MKITYTHIKLLFIMMHISTTALLAKHPIAPLLLQSDTTFTNFADTISYENTGLLDSVKIYAINPALNNNLNLLQSAAFTNSTVSPLLNTEDRAKTVNSILLDVAFVGTSVLTPQQLSILQGIAAECPYTEGTAVYDARVLVAPYDSTEYENSCETEYYIENNNGRMMQQNAKQDNDAVSDEERIGIYPNPADEVLNIIVNTSKEINIQIEIFSITGQLVLSKCINSSILQINIKELPAALYTVRIRTDRIILNKKLVINH